MITISLENLKIYKSSHPYYAGIAMSDTLLTNSLQYQVRTISILTGIEVDTNNINSQLIEYAIYEQALYTAENSESSGMTFASVRIQEISIAQANWKDINSLSAMQKMYLNKAGIQVLQTKSMSWGGMV